MRGDEEIRRRVATLDRLPDRQNIAGTVVHFVDVLGVVTNGFIADTYGGPIALEPGAADDLASRCRLLKTPTMKLSGDSPQEWVGVGGSSGPRRAGFRLSFGDVGPVTKPLAAGLYASTIIPAIHKGMWRVYLGRLGGQLFPRPWRAYQLDFTAGARVFEVSSAAIWSELVLAHAIVHEGLLYPNWTELAEKFDGIRMTPSAIVAMQGLRLLTPHGTVAETYWDVESTLWLRWCVKSSAPISDRE